MKKNFLFGGVLLASAFSFAQQSQNMLIEKNQSERVTTRTTETFDRAPGDIIGSIMDFSDPADWVIDNAGADPGGWVIGSDGPTGSFSGGMGVIESTSGGNFALFDADTHPGIAYLTMASSIDLTAYTNVAFEFESYYRNYTGSAFFEISVDGTTWTTFPVHELIPLNESTDNFELVSVNVTALAAGAATVWARFVYESTDDYAWMIDDVRFTEGFDNQLVLGQTFLSGGVEGWDYYKMPTDQVRPFTFGAYATNNGTEDQLNTALNVVVNDGATDVYDEESTPGTIPAFTLDSLELTTPVWTPSGDGTYTLTYSIASDATDQAPEDNVATLEPITVGGAVIARDNGVSSGSVGFLGGTSPVTVMGNYFEFVSDFSLAAVDIAVSSTSDPDEIMYAEIRKWNGTEFVNVAFSPDYTLSADDPGTFVRLVLDDIVDVLADEIYFIGAGHYGSEGVRIATAQTAEGVVIYSDGSAFQQNSVFMVRGVDNSEVGVGITEEEKVENVSIYPNPAKNSTIVSYNILQASNVSLVVTDISGKQISTVNFGLQTEGIYKQTVNTSDMSEGLYFYTLHIGEKEITNKLIISKK